MMTRIVYNRVGKAGSTAMTALLQFLAPRNNFHVVNDFHYMPDRAHLLSTLTHLPQDTVYINHCKYIELENEPIEDIIWINMVRDPIERQASLYYFQVSPGQGRSAIEELHRRDRSVNQCGCMNMEFDDCYRYYLDNTNCTDKLKVEPLEKFFADAPVNVKVGSEHFPQDKVYARIRDRYLFVGIVEEWELSVQMFEHLLPRFFKGATAYLKDQPHILNKTPEVNPLTHTTKTGAISTHVRDALKRYNHDEVLLYERIKRLFWIKIGLAFPDLADTDLTM